MKTNQFGEIMLGEQDLVDLVMQGHQPWLMTDITVDSDINIDKLAGSLQDTGAVLSWRLPTPEDIDVATFDRLRQSTWFMPQSYQDLDIAQHVLSLCQSQAELQRAGQELLMFQQRDLFDLLRYLKYLVDTMREHRVIWGVGRGSSVSSYVLYLLGVHRIDSLYYDLDPTEFLR